jgi:hypothetical protein
VTVSGTESIDWQYPRIGTCGEPIDTLRISLLRTRAIEDIIIGFDGERNGWVISGSFPNEAGDDFELREVAFVPEWKEDSR